MTAAILQLKNRLKKKFRIEEERGKTSITTDWFTFYTGFHKPCLQVSPCGYEDDRAMVIFSLGWGRLFLSLPIHSDIIDEDDAPEYGFYFHGDKSWRVESFWWLWGKEKYCLYMPWDWTWVRTSYLRQDGSWEHERVGEEKKDFYDHDKWLPVLWKGNYRYTYTLKCGEVQERIAAVRVVVREWRWRKLIKWAWSPKLVRMEIEVNFNDEVGERTGSWKGGVMGTGYLMRAGELPEQALRRMEKDLKF